MDTVLLEAKNRQEGVSAKTLRLGGDVPCVLYGNDTENISLQCPLRDLTKVYQKAGESTLVELDIGGKKTNVLIHAVQFDSLRDEITHIDFYAVDMKKEIEANVPIHFVGVSPAVKDLSGVMVTALDHVTVKCLPTNLPHAIDAHLEKLVEFTDAITVADLVIPEGVTVLQDPETMIATVQEPRKEEEVKVEAEEGEGTDEEAKDADGAKDAGEGVEGDKGAEGA